MSTVVILNGPPGVGKSTTAQLLAETAKNSVHVHADDIKHWIVNRTSEEITRGLTYINGGTCCRNYARAGFELIVFEYVFTQRQHVELFLQHCPLECSLFTLIAPLELIKKRERMRPNRERLGRAVDAAYHEIIADRADLGTLINTDTLSPREVCEHIRTQVYGGQSP